MKDKNADYLSIAELADRVGKTRQWIYRMIEKPEIAQYVRVVDGNKKVHKSVAWRFFNVNPEIEVDNVNTQETKPETPDQALVRILQEQLRNRDEEIKTLHEDLRMAQLLHAETAARLKESTDRLRALEDLQRRQETAEPDQADKSTQETQNGQEGPKTETTEEAPTDPAPTVRPDPVQKAQEEPERPAAPAGFFQRLASVFMRNR